MMKRGVLIAIFLSAGAALAQQPASKPAPKPGYDAFRLVRLRNIFDPNRRGIRGDGTAPAAVAPRAGGPLPNYITLTGAMVTTGRKLAFFSGARPEYNKVVSLRDRIADFTVGEITSGQVELRLAGKPVVVNVGQNVPLAGSSAAGQPGLQPAPEAAAPAPIASAAAPVSASASGAIAPPPGGSEAVLRRMMERRQREVPK